MSTRADLGAGRADGEDKMRTPEDVAREIGDAMLKPSRAEFSPFIDVVEIIRRDRREQAALVLPLVQTVLQQMRNAISDGAEGTSASFDGPYQYGAHVELSGETLKAAEQWLTAAEKL